MNASVISWLHRAQVQRIAAQLVTAGVVNDETVRDQTVHDFVYGSVNTDILFLPGRTGKQTRRQDAISIRRSSAPDKTSVVRWMSPCVDPLKEFVFRLRPRGHARTLSSLRSDTSSWGLAIIARQGAGGDVLFLEECRC